MSCLILEGDTNGNCTCSSNSGILLTCLLCVHFFGLWNMLLLVPKISLCISIFCNSVTFTCDYVMSIFLLTLYCWTELLWAILLTCCNFWASCTIYSCYCCSTSSFSTTSTNSWTRFSTPVCVRWILMLSSHPPFLIPPKWTLSKKLSHKNYICIPCLTIVAGYRSLHCVSENSSVCLCTQLLLHVPIGSPTCPSSNLVIRRYLCDPTVYPVLVLLGTVDPWIWRQYTLLKRTVVAQWLRYCATHQKVTGSIPDSAMEFFIDINPSDRTMALGSTQPLTEMSTRCISWG
jgi:hypothetical protein